VTLDAFRRHTAPLGALIGLSLALLEAATGRYFWNGDDAFELPMARLLATGEWSAWWEFSSLSGHTGLRVVPRFLWGLDSLLYGPDAAGYYATNIALHIACILAVYALCARWTESRVGGFTGAVVFGFLGPTAQVVSFLSAREDAVSALAFVGAVLLWPGAEGSRRRLAGVVALYAVICLSKLSGVVLPGVLLVMDVAQVGVRAAFSPRRLLRLYGPLVLVLVGMVAAWAGLIGIRDAGSYAALRGGGSDAASVLLGNLYQGLLWPLADHPSNPLSGVDRGLMIAQAVLLPLCVIVGLARGGKALGALAVAWIVLGLLPPAALLGWNAEQSWGDGRYFYLPSMGVALLAASASARGRVPGTIGVVVVVVMVAVFGRLVMPQFALQGQFTRHLGRATEEAASSLGPDGRLVVVWPRADQGVRRILDGGFLRAVAPSLPDRFYVLPEGTTTLLSVALGDNPRLDEVMVVHTGFRLTDLVPGRDALVHQGVRSHPIFDVGRRFTPAILPLTSPEAAAGGSMMGWTFAGVAATWRTGPGLSGADGFDVGDARAGDPAPARDGALRWTTTGALDWPGNPEPPRTLYLPEIVSGKLPMDAQQVCGLEVDMTVSSPPAPKGRRALEPWNFGVLSWATRPRGAHFGAALAFEVVPGPQTISIDLGNSPSWRDSATVYRLGLTPSARKAEVAVRSVHLTYCER
jgi:hypothetical protein